MSKTNTCSPKEGDDEQVTMENIRSKMICKKTGKLFVFGYGAVLWKPNFPFSQCWLGYIDGYKRRFYQTSTSHRGTPEKPGLCATILPSEGESRLWGIGFEVTDPKQIKYALEQLIEREVILGGYRYDTVEFHGIRRCSDSFDPRASDDFAKCLENLSLNKNPEEITFSAQVFIALPGNSQYTGPQPIINQAKQIATASGFCGPNHEYLFKICDFSKRFIPAEELVKDEDYLFLLEYLVKNYLEHNQ